MREPGIAGAASPTPAKAAVGRHADVFTAATDVGIGVDAGRIEAAGMDASCLKSTSVIATRLEAAGMKTAGIKSAVVSAAAEVAAVEFPAAESAAVVSAEAAAMIPAESSGAMEPAAAEAAGMGDLRPEQCQEHRDHDTWNCLHSIHLMKNDLRVRCQGRSLARRRLDDLHRRNVGKPNAVQGAFDRLPGEAFGVDGGENVDRRGLAAVVEHAGRLQHPR